MKADEQARLPAPGTAVVRRFDAPEALDTRFYEVRAKSALNRVPEPSRVPFGGRSTRTGAALMPAFTASPGPPTSTSTSTPGATSRREIVVKVNVPEVLRAELARPSWKREHIAMGTNTDPYQWVEGRYKLMRGIWAALRDAANPCSILTKSPLLLRDLDLMLEVASADRDQRLPVGADAGREGVAGERAAHAASARAAGGGGGAQPRPASRRAS